MTVLSDMEICFFFLFCNADSGAFHLNKSHNGNNLRSVAPPAFNLQFYQNLLFPEKLLQTDPYYRGNTSKTNPAHISKPSHLSVAPFNPCRSSVSV